jgi:hypothetical protein
MPRMSRERFDRWRQITIAATQTEKKNIALDIPPCQLIAKMTNGNTVAAIIEATET